MQPRSTVVPLVVLALCWPLLDRPFTPSPRFSGSSQTLAHLPCGGVSGRSFVRFSFPAASLIRRSSLGTPDDVLPMLTLLLPSLSAISLLPTVMITIHHRVDRFQLLCPDSRPTPQIA